MIQNMRCMLTTARTGCWQRLVIDIDININSKPAPLKPKIYRNTMNFSAVQTFGHQLNFLSQRFQFLFESYAPLIGKTIKANQQNQK